MAVNYPSNGGREEYVPVSLTERGGETVARPVFSKSGLINLLSQAAGYVRVPRDSEGLIKGEPVTVTLL